jgi:hypothetical protein
VEVVFDGKIELRFPFVADYNIQFVFPYHSGQYPLPRAVLTEEMDARVCEVRYSIKTTPYTAFRSEFVHISLYLQN